MKLGGLGFKRYLVTMLVMFYLQKKKFLPSIKLAQSGLTTKEIDGEIGTDSDYKNLIYPDL